MKILKEEKNNRLILDEDDFVILQHKLENGKWDNLFSLGILASDYIKELLEKIDDLENELIEYAEFD